MAFKKDLIQSGGWVTVILRHGKYAGDTIRDNVTIREITGSAYFKVEDYDKVLAQLSEYGLGLEVKEMENPKSVADDVSARELELWIESDADLYRQMHTPIIKNLMAKKARGVYSHDKAIKLFEYLTEEGARRYGGKKDRDIPSYFNKATRRLAAESLHKSFEAEAELGNYDSFIPKKYRNPGIAWHKKERAKRTKQRNRFKEGTYPRGFFTGMKVAHEDSLDELKRFKKNPNPAVRIVYNRLLGGWYIVRGPHQTPIGGRFESKEEAQEWLSTPPSERGKKKNPFGSAYEVASSKGYPYIDTDAVYMKSEFIDPLSYEDEYRGKILLTRFTKDEARRGPALWVGLNPKTKRWIIIFDPPQTGIVGIGQSRKNPSLFQAIKKAGIPYETHESDLYLPATKEVLELIKKYHPQSNIQVFKSEIDGKTWIDIPFAYEPWWEKRTKKNPTLAVFNPPHKKWYWGSSLKKHKLHPPSALVFTSAVTPTRESHGGLYGYVTGPFKTRKAAAEDAESLHYEVYGANPPEDILSNDALELAYIHAEDGKSYKHDFEKSGTKIKLQPDGSVKIYNPKHPLWRDF